jgi:glycosyltransferase involved in cell wall biosynthesis
MIREVVSRAVTDGADTLVLHVKLRLLPENLALDDFEIAKVFLESDAFFNFIDNMEGEKSLQGKLDMILQQSKIDLVVTRDEYSCENLRRQGIRSMWSPHAASPDECFRPNGKWDYDAAFIGATYPTMYPERRSIVESLRGLGGRALVCDETLRISDEEYVRVLNRSKIFVTAPIGARGVDVTEAKLYEAMAAGCCVFRRQTRELDLLGFERDEHYVNFSSSSELMEKIDQYLSDDVKRRRVAQNGQKFVCDRHTWHRRADEFLDEITQISDE